MMINDMYKGRYSSVWDVDGSGRGHIITTDCQIDPDTGLVDAESASDEESSSVDILDREYVEVEGKEFAVKEGRVDISELTDHLNARGRVDILPQLKQGASTKPKLSRPATAATPDPGLKAEVLAKSSPLINRPKA